MWIKVRIKGTGQVEEMVPDVARTLIANGIAEEVGKESKSVNTPQAAVSDKRETAALPGPVTYTRGPITRPVAR